MSGPVLERIEQSRREEELIYAREPDATDSQGQSVRHSEGGSFRLGINKTGIDGSGIWGDFHRHTMISEGHTPLVILIGHHLSIGFSGHN